MEISVVLVEPIYQINIGYAARICKNFGARELVLVNPRCKPNGKNALKYSKHGADVLANARICKSMEEAVGSSLAIGSTSIWRKASASLYNIYSLNDMASILKENSIGKISLVFGRESTGLTREELMHCQASVFIPVRSSYTTLNISHALAIMLYELAQAQPSKRMRSLYATETELERVLTVFKLMLESKRNIRSKKTVYAAFEQILKRAKPTKRELSALAVGLSERER